MLIYIYIIKDTHKKKRKRKDYNINKMIKSALNGLISII